MDTEDGLIYEEKPFHGIKVKAATIDKLVTYCLDQFGKQYSYILIHYMSLVSFCTPPPLPCPLKTFFLCVWRYRFDVLRNLVPFVQFKNVKNTHGSDSAASRCILIPFEPYGRPKKTRPKSSCNTFSIYISRKT